MNCSTNNVEMALVAILFDERWLKSIKQKNMTDFVDLKLTLRKVENNCIIFYLPIDNANIFPVVHLASHEYNAIF